MTFYKCCFASTTITNQNKLLKDIFKLELVDKKLRDFKANQFQYKKTNYIMPKYYSSM